MRLLALLFYFLFPLLLSASTPDSTYTENGTTYYYNQYYKTGQPKVKRSAAAKRAFLKSQGLTKTPKGYEIDHIIPLHQGGTDTPDNMQLLTIEEHKEKTREERQRLLN